MSATNADPLAAALRVVLDRRGKNHVLQDDLPWSRQVREVAQICWMQAGEPDRLREEDEDRSKVCFDLVRGWGSVRRQRCRLVPSP